MSLLFVGDWGDALRAIKACMARADKNGLHHYGQGMRVWLALFHLFAIDVAGALSICEAALALELPSYNRRLGLAFAGSAAIGCGMYERALEHFIDSEGRDGSENSWS